MGARNKKIWTSDRSSQHFSKFDSPNDKSGGRGPHFSLEDVTVSPTRSKQIRRLESRLIRFSKLLHGEVNYFSSVTFLPEAISWLAQ